VTAEPGEGGAHLRLADLVDLDAVSDIREERHGQLAAEVLAELGQPRQHGRPPVRAGGLERRIPEPEAEPGEQ
jgi:hypothetical protein